MGLSDFIKSLFGHKNGHVKKEEPIKRLESTVLEIPVPKRIEDSFLDSGIAETVQLSKEEVTSEFDDAADAADEAMATLMQQLEASEERFDATATQMELKLNSAETNKIRELFKSPIKKKAANIQKPEAGQAPA